jgi:hypothetical protein
MFKTIKAAVLPAVFLCVGAAHGQINRADLDSNVVGFYNNEILWTKNMYGSLEDIKINEILLLDLYSYYGLRSVSSGYAEKYDSELKRKVFEQSEEYSEKLEYLKNLRQKMLQTVFCLQMNKETIGKYNLDRQSFFISTGNCLYDGGFSGYIIFGKDFTMKVDEKTAVKIEDNPNVAVYVYFMFNGKIEKKDHTSPAGHVYGYLKYVDKMRVVVAHKETGEIYFDESSPKGCLPLTLQERLTPEEYQAYLAEQEKQKALEKRKKQEQILQARRAEEEQIETEKRQKEEQIEAENRRKEEQIEAARLAKLKRKENSFRYYLTFDNGDLSNNLTGQEKSVELFTYGDYLSNSLPTGNFDPKFITDTKGKAIQLKKKGIIGSLDRSNGATLNEFCFSFWLKNCKPNSTSEEIFTERGVHELKNDPMLLFVYNKEHKISPYKKGLIRLDVGSNSLRLSAPSFYKSFKLGIDIYSKQWHHIAVVASRDYDDRNIKKKSSLSLYIDGKLIEQFDDAFFIEPSEYDKRYWWFVGDPKAERMIFDNVRIYDWGLTDEEIAAIYEEEKQ